MSVARPVAIVTGGVGEGIGSGVTRVLARDGWDVLVADRDASKSSQFMADLRTNGYSVDFLHIDLTEEEAPSRIVQKALGWRGRIDGLVNNAGVGCVGPADRLTDEQYDAVFAINVRACFRMTREVCKHLAKPGGAIVNLASVHGRQPLRGFSVYGATKGAVEAITRGWAVDFGADGIRVNCIVPGMVDCAQTRRVMANSVDDVDSYLATWSRTRQVLPQLVTNVNVGELAAFLLGPKSQGITGQSIVIDAGTTLMLTDRDSTC